MKKYLILLAMMFMGNVVRADNPALRINLQGGYHGHLHPGVETGCHIPRGKRDNQKRGT